MKLNEIVKELNLKVHNPEAADLDAEISSGYCSDLLSDVMANAKDGSIWITLQTHNNIVAVAVLRSLACVILVNNRQPENDTLKKANDENIAILATDLTTFEVVGKLYKMGITS
jgi:hypothetical protein